MRPARTEIENGHSGTLLYRSWYTPGWYPTIGCPRCVCVNFLTWSRAVLPGRYEHRGSVPKADPLSGGEGNICSVAVGGWTHVRWSPPPAGHSRATPEPPDRARVARQRSNVRIVATLARPEEPGVGQSLPDRRRRPAQPEVFDVLPLLKEGDSYGSRCRVFCFRTDCPPGELR